jgi:hypothetical protein
MALEEATRLITVRQGERVTRIPAMQAVFRSMFRLAAEGDPIMQRQLINLVARVESDRAALAKSYLEEAITYKERAEEVIRQHNSQGRPPPNFYPHPDDVLINLHTGEVVIDGPLTEEQAAAQEFIREISIQKLMRFFEVESALAKDPTSSALKKEMIDLQKYKDFLEGGVERRIRHESLRQVREGFKRSSPKPKLKLK